MNEQKQRISDIAQKHAQLSGLLSEDTLDLSLSPLDTLIARDEIALCKTYIKVRNLATDLVYKIDQVKLRSFDFLFDEANKKIIYGVNYVTALEISFGIVAGTNKITPIYTPLYLQRINPVPPSPNNYGVIDRCGDFVYDGTRFNPATPTELNYKTIYKNDILIKHLGDANPSAFIPGVDPTSVIFPFQTIYALENDNPGITELWLYNAIRKTAVVGGDDIKHCILLSPEIKGEPLFGGKFANRGHLCPPDCNSVFYTRV